MITKKFRAWDEENEIMFYPKSLTFFDDVIYAMNEDGDYEYQLDPKYVMQSSGLTDIHGIEMYEGDIVRDRTFSRVDGKQNDELYRIVQTVHQGSGTSSFKLGLMYSSGYITDTRPFLYEIVGNIYQNKELLDD